jgi:elongation factor 1 alpha-like protein
MSKFLILRFHVNHMSPAGKPSAKAVAIKQQPHPVAPISSTATDSNIEAFAFNTPSPDDAVLANQRERGVSSVNRGSAPAAATLSDVNASLGTCSISSGKDDAQQPHIPSSSSSQRPPAAPRSWSEYSPDPELKAACTTAADADAHPGAKPRLHLAVLGHVDAGKSTLMGRLLYELKVVDDRAVHRAKRDSAAAGKGSFAWAWMLDERPEERARGVTVDVAVARFETPSRTVTLLDAPGHRDFVPNMIGGAAQADAALLVVDGSPGGFEAGFASQAPGSPEGGGQTREHAQLARSLGVEQLAVVITKLDACNYSQERFEGIKSMLGPYLSSCGFRENAVQWLPAVGPSGENLMFKPQNDLLASWWHGPTLVEAIDAFVPVHRLVERPLRMPVSETGARGKGGVIAAGKLEGGAVRPGSRVLIVPGRELATVKAVEVDGKTASVARAGDSADLVLGGIEPNVVRTGVVVCHPEFEVPLATRFEARVVILEVPIPVLQGQQVTIHVHAARENGTVTRLLSLLDAKTGEVSRRRPRCLLKGQTAVIEIVPGRPIPLETYAQCRALGRVALRDGGRTLAVGIVTAVHE